MGFPAPRHLDVSLTEETYRDLNLEARRANQPVATIARQAIEDWLRRKQITTLHDAVAAYAAANAGTDLDLDPLLESASIEHWLELDESRQ